MGDSFLSALDNAWDEKQQQGEIASPKGVQRQKTLDRRRNSTLHNPETRSAEWAKTGTEFEKDLLYVWKQKDDKKTGGLHPHITVDRKTGAMRKTTFPNHQEDLLRAFEFADLETGTPLAATTPVNLPSWESTHAAADRKSVV